MEVHKISMMFRHLSWWQETSCSNLIPVKNIVEMKVRYFNPINFREIKFRVFANFCPFREIKTRENAWDCWLAKLNPPRNFWNRIFFNGEAGQNSQFEAKNRHFHQLLSGISIKFALSFCALRFLKRSFINSPSSFLRAEDKTIKVLNQLLFV